MDSSKIQFSSAWDIKQIMFGESKDMSITGGAYPPAQFLVKDFTSLGLTKPPIVLARIKNQGSNYWFLPGGGLYLNGFDPGPRIDIAVTSTTLHIQSWVSGTHNITIEYYLLTGSASSI